eukprot:9962322-Lingulodinium_polyedra.AAC.1
MAARVFRSSCVTRAPSEEGPPRSGVAKIARPLRYGARPAIQNRNGYERVDRSFVVAKGAPRTSETQQRT